MREREIEKKVIQAVEDREGICPKWTGWTGCPDRIVFLPKGKIGFIEVKAPGMKPRPIQAARHRTLSRLGFKVYVIDGTDQIEGVLDRIGGTG